MKKCGPVVEEAVALARQNIEDMEAVSDPAVLGAWLRAVRAENGGRNALRRNAFRGFNLPTRTTLEKAGVLLDPSVIRDAAFSLPPLYGSAEGFATIRAAVRTAGSQGRFQDLYPYLSYDACSQVAHIETHLKRLYEECRSVFPIHDVLDQTRGGGFDAFFAIFVARQRVPVWLTNAGLVADGREGQVGEGARAAASATGPTLPVIAEAMQQLLGISRGALTHLQSTLSAKTVHTSVFAAKAGARGALEGALIGAALRNPGVGSGDAVVFDEAIDAAPEFAKAALANYGGGAIEKGTTYREASLSGGAEGTPLYRAYTALKRIEHNFAFHGNDYGENLVNYIEAEKARAAALNLLGMVAQPKKSTDVAAAAERINTIVENIIAPAIGPQWAQMGDNVITPTAATYLALKSKTEAFFDANPTNRQAFSNKTRGAVMTAFTLAEQAAAASGQAAKGVTPGERAAVAAQQMGFVASDYVQTSLVAGPKQFAALVPVVTDANRPVFALSDPKNLDALGSAVVLRSYADIVNGGGYGANTPVSLLPGAYYEHPRTGPPPVHAAEMILAASRKPQNPNAYSVVVSTSISERISAESSARGARYDPMEIDSGVRSRHFEDEVSAPVRAHQEIRASHSVVDQRLPDYFAHRNFRTIWDSVDREAGTDFATAIAAKVYLTASTRVENWVQMHDKDVVVPCTVLIARPFWTLEGLMVLKVARGGRTAWTYVAKPTTSWGDNAQIQAWTLTTTYYAKTIVHTMKNVRALVSCHARGLILKLLRFIESPWVWLVLF